MHTLAIRSQIHRLRSDMTEMRGHLDDMLGKMDSFTGLATRTAEEADTLAKSLTRPSIRAWNPFSSVGGWLTIAGLTIAGLAIFSPRTLDSLWRQVQDYVPRISSMIGTPTGMGTGTTAGTQRPTGQPNRPNYP